MRRGTGRPSWSSRALPAILRLTGRTRQYVNAQSAREHIEQRALRPRAYGPPPRLRPDVVVAVRRRSGWPIVKLAAETVSPGHTVCLAGDSAGGQIALSVALLLRDDCGVVVPRTVLISPVLDISLTNPLIAAVEPTDPWLGREALLVFAERWRADLSLTDPRVSPLAADLSGLGPLTVLTGTRDILNPDARLLAQKATAAGVTIDYHEHPGLVHVYPLTPTPEGRAARATIVERLRG